MDKSFSLALIAILIGIVSACSSGEAPSQSSSSFKKPTATSTSAVRTQSEWYKGGTLHRSDVSTWRAASYQNRLATCGDFSAASLSDEQKRSLRSMDDLKTQAVGLCECINVAVRDLSSDMDDTSIASIGSMCIALME